KIFISGIETRRVGYDAPTDVEQRNAATNGRGFVRPRPVAPRAAAHLLKLCRLEDQIIPSDAVAIGRQIELQARDQIPALRFLLGKELGLVRIAVGACEPPLL